MFRWSILLSRLSFLYSIPNLLSSFSYSFLYSLYSFLYFLTFSFFLFWDDRLDELFTFFPLLLYLDPIFSISFQFYSLLTNFLPYIVLLLLSILTIYFIFLSFYFCYFSSLSKYNISFVHIKIFYSCLMFYLCLLSSHLLNNKHSSVKII